MDVPVPDIPVHNIPLHHLHFPVFLGVTLRHNWDIVVELNSVRNVVCGGSTNSGLLDRCHVPVNPSSILVGLEEEPNVRLADNHFKHPFVSVVVHNERPGNVDVVP